MRKFLLFFIFVSLFSITGASGGENLWTVPPFKIEGKGSRLLTRVTVEPYQRYNLEFKARSAGSHTIESRPALEQLLRIRSPKMIPIESARATLIVNDAKNRNCIPTYVARTIYIYSEDWQTCNWEFYAPAAAEFLNVRFDSLDGLEVEGISLRKVTDAACLNPNPGLNMNKYHFPGYGNLYKTIVREDGGLDIAGWTVCDPIPVEPGERLKLTVDGEAAGRLLIRTNFYRDPPDDKNFISRNKTAIAIQGPRKTLEYVVAVPPETRWLRLSLSSGTIYGVKLEKIKE